MIILQLLINAVALGAAYALIALGFVLILNAANAVNFAHGDLVTAGGFAAVLAAYVLPLPGVLLLPVVAVMMFGFGLLFSAIAYLPIRDRPPVAVFVSTLAVGIVLQNAANVVAGPAPRVAPTLFGGGVWTIGGLAVEKQSAAIVAAAALLVAGLYGLLFMTQAGRRLRATAQDREIAATLGIPVLRYVAFTFGLGVALAGLAGMLLGSRFFVSPADGFTYMILAYMAVTIGGWGSVPGAVAGAFVIAIFDVFVSAYLSRPVALALLYAAVLIILMVRPQGLFGERMGRRA